MHLYPNTSVDPGRVMSAVPFADPSSGGGGACPQVGHSFPRQEAPYQSERDFLRETLCIIKKESSSFLCLEKYRRGIELARMGAK